MIRIADTKSCPKCGKKFECYSDDDCWCENYQIHRKEYLVLKQQFDDCICPDCLKDYSEE